MRLKHLDLQGYKTFATKTDFLFNSGITAIVGPNGTGKSNIADAVRWVLGEQSYSLLRAKRTEDMIFSGSAQRPRLGMAQVSLTLDNCDGWLPVEYSEVTIGRRAYRSGENEYLLNGKRVRLKDITELLTKGGLSRRTYTVIGQGLIDAALSLRPEERRILFEEAAGITVFQAKRQEAIAKLEATQGNILRVNDIINEIAPRLEHLEDQAQRAHEYNRLSKELERLLRIWHGYRWRQKQKALSLAKAKVEAQRRQLDQRQVKLEELERRIARARTQQSERRRNLSDWHHQYSALRAQAESTQRELAVCQERDRLLNRQREEILAEIATLELNCTAQQERVEKIEGELGRIESELSEQRAQVREAQERLDARQRQRIALSKELTAAQKQVFDLATALADRGNRLVQLDERRTELEQEKREQQMAIAEGEDQLALFKSYLQALQAEMDDLKAKREALVRQRGELEAAVEACRERQNKQWSVLAEAREEEGRLQTRREMLLRMRHDMAGYHAGVRAVLQAGGRGQEVKSQRLKGIIGVVAGLIQVPAELERALEAVLGPHLQDIVVESQTEAEEALKFLKEKGAGKATFLPSDAIRPLETLSPP
ncbi:MAG: chromosome segregation SMC family protein, partial [Anaerolineae bacterium]